MTRITTNHSPLPTSNTDSSRLELGMASKSREKLTKDAVSWTVVSGKWQVEDRAASQHLQRLRRSRRRERFVELAQIILVQFQLQRAVILTDMLHRPRFRDGD